MENNHWLFESTRASLQTSTLLVLTLTWFWRIWLAPNHLRAASFDRLISALRPALAAPLLFLSTPNEPPIALVACLALIGAHIASSHRLTNCRRALLFPFVVPLCLVSYIQLAAAAAAAASKSHPIKANIAVGLVAEVGLVVCILALAGWLLYGRRRFYPIQTRRTDLRCPGCMPWRATISLGVILTAACARLALAIQQHSSHPPPPPHRGWTAACLACHTAVLVAYFALTDGVFIAKILSSTAAAAAAPRQGYHTASTDRSDGLVPGAVNRRIPLQHWRRSQSSSDSTD
jgi:hypothetical protein